MGMVAGVRRSWNAPGFTAMRELGSGGFGDVVLARHDASGTLVAIKYLHRGLLDDPEFAAMFRAEASVLATLQDPNVVRLYEYIESPAGAAIVMELVDGVSLREILSRLGKTTAEAALVVLRGSLLGLAAAHARGVVHRDYKPENVLVDGTGASKLTDFGIAARAGDRPMPSGTLAYAPPEQFTGAPASPASDVYAATATFYECLTGHPPFSGPTTEMLLQQHQSEPVPLDTVPGPLRPLITAGMAKDPRDRPADAGSFLSALQTAAVSVYGQDWEDRGRSRLGEAALLLAALWPSGAAPAVQGAAVEHVNLIHNAQAPSTPQAPSHTESRHLWHLKHLRHLLHLEHLKRLRVAIGVGVGAAVVAGVAVAVASGSSHGSGAPGDYVINRQISAVSPWVLTLTDIRVTASGQAEFVIKYANTGSATAQLTCSGNTDPAIDTVTRSNGQAIPATATYCSQHPDQTTINIGPGQSLVSYAIFPDASQLRQPFTLHWSAGSMSGDVDGLKIPA
jgi:serine/threonine protein kinase